MGRNNAHNPNENSEKSSAKVDVDTFVVTEDWKSILNGINNFLRRQVNYDAMYV